MKYKNYECIREDERNWKLVRYDQAVADRDILNIKSKEVLHAKGETYTREVFKGFYGDVFAALTAIVKDICGTGCEDIADLIKQVDELKADLRKVVEL